MPVNYRMDKSERLPTRHAYSVPCGMNTIVYISNKPYNIQKIISKAYALRENEVYIHSKWDKNKRDFIIYAVTEN